MKVGYARVSTLDQHAGMDAQLRDLEAAGVEKIFQEQISAVAQRPQLEAALDFIREGDTLIVTKLDRLARSTHHLLEIAERVKAEKADLSILNLGADTSTATGLLMFTVIGAIAAFERELMLERQKEGVARAKAEGKYKGRKPTARARANEVAALKAQGVRPVDIARRLGIGRASVYGFWEAQRDNGSGGPISVAFAGVELSSLRPAPGTKFTYRLKICSYHYRETHGHADALREHLCNGQSQNGLGGFRHEKWILFLVRKPGLKRVS